MGSAGVQDDVLVELHDDLPRAGEGCGRDARRGRVVRRDHDGIAERAVVVVVVGHGEGDRVRAGALGVKVKVGVVAPATTWPLLATTDQAYPRLEPSAVLGSVTVGVMVTACPAATVRFGPTLVTTWTPPKSTPVASWPAARFSWVGAAGGDADVVDVPAFGGERAVGREAPLQAELLAVEGGEVEGHGDEAAGGVGQVAQAVVVGQGDEGVVGEEDSDLREVR